MSIVAIFCWAAGIAGAIAFGTNLLPQLVKSLSEKSTGLSYGFFVLALIGNIGSAICVFWNNLQTGVWQWQLYGNYMAATALTVWLLVLRIKYRK